MTTEEAYRLLELRAPADADQVKRAYRRKALEYHPDRWAREDEKAFYQRKFIQVREAYARLREGVPELPAEEAVVPEFRDDYLAGRRFAPKETEDVPAAEKLGLKFPFRVESLVLWGMALPAAAVALVYSLRWLVEAIKGGTP